MINDFVELCCMIAAGSVVLEPNYLYVGVHAVKILKRLNKADFM